MSQLQGRGERQKDKYERRLLRAFCLAPKLDRLALRLNHLCAPKIITTIKEKSLEPSALVLVLLIEGSKFSIKSCDYFKCIWMRLDAQKM